MVKTEQLSLFHLTHIQADLSDEAQVHDQSQNTELQQDYHD